MREPDRADPVLGEIGRHAGRLLGPRDPQHAGRRERALERRESALEFPLPIRKELNEIERADDSRLAPHPQRQLAQHALIAAGRIEDRDVHLGLDPELGEQRPAGVAGGYPSPFPRPSSPALHRPLYITRQIVPAASSVIYSDPSGPTATPTGRCLGPAGSSFQKPSANVS